MLVELALGHQPVRRAEPGGREGSDELSGVTIKDRGVHVVRVAELGECLLPRQLEEPSHDLGTDPVEREVLLRPEVQEHHLAPDFAVQDIRWDLDRRYANHRVSAVHSSEAAHRCPPLLSQATGHVASPDTGAFLEGG